MEDKEIAEAYQEVWAEIEKFEKKISRILPDFKAS